MVAIVSTVAYLGLEARAVEVQVQLIAGLPAFNLARASVQRSLGRDVRVHLRVENLFRHDTPPGTRAPFAAPKFATRCRD